MIDLKDYINLIKKRYILILIITLVFAVLGFIYAKFTPTKYESSINIYTNDASDLTGYLQTNHAIESAYKNFNGSEKYTNSSLSYFRSNIRSIQVSNNIVSLQITTSQKLLSLKWIEAFEGSIYKNNTRVYIQKILNKDYSGCIKAQKQAIRIDRINKKLIIVPSCIKESFIEYNPGEISNISILPSKTLDILLFAISGAILSLIIVSYKEYRQQ